MTPISLKPDAFGRRILRADAEITVLAFGYFDGERNGAVAGERSRLLDRQAGKDAELAQAVGGLAQLFRE